MSAIVTHITYGEGAVEKLYAVASPVENRILVKFSKRDSSFCFPDAFINEPAVLSTSDNDLLKLINERKALIEDNSKNRCSENNDEAQKRKPEESEEHKQKTEKTLIPKEKTQKENNGEELLPILENKGFEGFLSYTNFSPNFLNIMRSGVQYSRKDNPFNSWDSASESVIDNDTPEWVKSYVRFYYKSHTPTFYYREGIKLEPNDNIYSKYDYAHEPMPVCLVYNKDIVFDEKIVLSNGRIGNDNTTEITSDTGNALKWNWDYIFHRGQLSEDDPSKSIIVNARHAEFLYPHSISTSKLKKIYFRSEADLKHAVFELGPNPLYEVNEKMFNLPTLNYFGDRNFLKDYEVMLDREKQSYLVSLEFFRNAEKYNHKIIIKYINHDQQEIPLNDLKFDSYSQYTGCSMESLIRFNYDYCDIDRVEYLLNGNVSAVWR